MSVFVAGIIRQIAQSRGLIIYDIMRKPNSIIVLIHIFISLQKRRLDIYYIDKRLGN